jgi:hypothetical protein
MLKTIIKSILWCTIFSCLFTILTVHDPRAFGIVAFVGFLCTWVLFRWDKFEDYLDE